MQRNLQTSTSKTIFPNKSTGRFLCSYLLVVYDAIRNKGFQESFPVPLKTKILPCMVSDGNKLYLLALVFSEIIQCPIKAGISGDGDGWYVL